MWLNPEHNSAPSQRSTVYTTFIYKDTNIPTNRQIYSPFFYKSPNRHESEQHLAMLGYTAASQKVIKAILKEQPSVSVEAAIKEALRRM